MRVGRGGMLTPRSRPTRATAAAQPHYKAQPQYQAQPHGTRPSPDASPAPEGPVRSRGPVARIEQSARCIPRAAAARARQLPRAYHCDVIHSLLRAASSALTVRFSQHTSLFHA